MSNLRIVTNEISSIDNVKQKDHITRDELKKLKTLQYNNKKDTAGVSVIGASWDLGAPVVGSSLGPSVYKHYSNLINEYENITGCTRAATYSAYPIQQEFVIARISCLCSKLALKVSQTLQQDKKFAVVGGDHSCAIGTWNGVADALGSENPFGLIWIDAHLDAHTPKTSLTGNIHAMPVAALLGYGHEKLLNILSSSPPLRPENIVVIGARNIECDEAMLLRDLGVRIYFMPEVKQRGLDIVVAEALEVITKHTENFGVSIDLDAINPKQAPGVNTPEKGGLNAKQLIKLMQPLLIHKGFVGVEIAEFNPLNDQLQQTVHIIDHLLESLFPELLNNDKSLINSGITRDYSA